MSLKNPRDRVSSRDGLDVREVLDSFSDHTQRGARKYGNSRRRVTGPVLIICAVVSVLVAANYWANAGTILGGVTVGNVPVGGETPEEAREVIEEQVVGGREEIRFSSGSEKLTLTADEVGVSFEVRAAVEDAYAIGRRGSILERLGDRVEAVRGTVRVPLAVDYERERLRDALSGVFATLAVEPVEAVYEVRDDEVYVTKSRAGKGVDEEKLLDDVEVGLSEGKREYEVPVGTAEPDLTTDEAERLKPTELIGQYRTDYTLSSDKSEERVENLRISSNAVDGTVLAPGEVFSFNELAAPLEYNETKVIVGGKEDYADGGGLCQVSSTLYMAANYAGLDIVERTPHSAMLPYIRPGLDATVWFGSLDMKFENTTDGYVLVREYVADDGYVYAEIWGRPTGREVEMSSEMVSANPDSATWVTYQEVKEDGELVFDGVLHEDTYYALETTDGEVVAPGSFAPAPVDP